MFAIAARIFWKDVKIIISALRPEKFFSPRMVLKNFFLRLAKPDLILVQSHEAKRRFLDYGCKVEWLPNGVDIQRFVPVISSEKSKLRMKFDLSSDHPVVLHVGHFQSTRNMEKLIPLKEKQIQVVIVGSIYLGTDEGLVDRLESNGFKIIKGFQSNVEELYQLSDCYVFPLETGNSLSMPLSVLEAMACNLLIVSTRFNGLETAFKEGDGLIFVDTPDDIVTAIYENIYTRNNYRNREKVESFSWEKISLQLSNYYTKMLGEQ